MAQTQVPLVQVVPAGHRLPHLPQLRESLVVSAQADPHAVSPIGHWQAPPMQDWSTLQAWPHMPQSLALVSRSTQAPLQVDWPAAQATAHTPLEQTSPSLQAIPHCPQCCGSVFTFTQASPHRRSSPGQRHLPVAQNIFAPQVIPQAPQFLGSLARSTQVKVVLVGGQGLSDSAQATTGPPPVPRRGAATSPPALASTPPPPASGPTVESPSFFGELHATRETRTKDKLVRIKPRSVKG